MGRSPVVRSPYRIQCDAENMPGGLPARVQGKIPREEVCIVQQIVFGGATATGAAVGNLLLYALARNRTGRIHHA